MPKRPKPPKQECARLEWAAPAGGWHCGNLIYVYCTIKGISAEVCSCASPMFPLADRLIQLLDTFFLQADRCVFAGRPYFLCLVRSDETHHYQPRRREMSAHYRTQGLFFVYESDLAHSTPASLFRVSIELDEHTTRDRATCLLRKNGRRDRQGFAEVRCHFSIALRAAVALWCRRVSIVWLQSEAALYGGAVPSQETRGARLRLSGPYIPYELSVPCTSSPANLTCPVFAMPRVPKDIIDDFLGSVNLPFDDLEQSSLVGLFDINVDRGAEPYVLKHVTLSTLPSRSIDLSMATICNFIRQNCASSTLNARHFVVLDDLTATDLLPKPRQPTVFNNLRALTCLIGDTCARDDDGQPLLVRCSFDACGAILRDLSRGITSLRTCANSAAVDYGGCINYPISYPTSLIIMASNARSAAPRSIDVTGILPSPNNGTESGTNHAKKEAHTAFPSSSRWIPAHKRSSLRGRRTMTAPSPRIITTTQHCRTVALSDLASSPWIRASPILPPNQGINRI
ncbi:hypothetical protein B0J12DRAFT_323845 [Macrophomina phaseolina]|uniref:Uncharacterized protein n=1 Tax=Macrophomina phaseolina TaxID=35725 RepID=A0ABQ8FVP8_9PEZI|nr:hypothetical protein B0J12DRAFT_323845 [Macrophomina phaseolina]